MAIQKPSHIFTKIHLKALQTKSFHILFFLSFTVFINTFGFAQEIPKEKPVIPVTPTKETTTIGLDSLLGKPINIKEGDTIKNDSLVKKKEFLEDIVK